MMIYDPASLIDDRFLRHSGGPVVSENERRVLRMLHRHAGLSRADLSTRFDLRQQSLHRIVDQLAARGILRMGPPRIDGGRGQPSPTLNLHSGFAHVWGVALNTDDISIALMDFAGNVLLQEQHLLGDRQRSQVLDDLRDRINAVTRERGLDRANCFGVGFGIAGYWVGGTRFNAPEPLAEWSLIELGPMLSEHLGYPVWVQNSANLGAVGEAMAGLGKGFSTFAYISCNYGMGGGLIHDGQLWDGGNGNAGELSGMYDPIEIKDRPALRSLLQHLQERGVDITSVSQVHDAFDPDWPDLDEWVWRVLPAFNRLLAALWAIFDPQAIILGGQLPADLAHRLIDRAVLHPAMRYGVPRPAPNLLISTLGPRAAAIGAAAHPLRICAL